jgi:DNA-binding CsgD family transcriptional regulator
MQDHWLTWSGAVLGLSEGQALWAQYYRQTGDAAQAGAHAERALAQATNPRQPLALLAAHRLLGALATDAGRFEDAATHLDASLRLAEACAAPYERALTLLALAELHATTGNESESWTGLAAVRALCTPLGAAPTLARANNLATRLTAHGTPQPAGPDRLTIREREVLRLVAGGLSNREIAAALFISERTVNRHMTNLYTKIDAHSKADATAWAIRHHLA